MIQSIFSIMLIFALAGCSNKPEYEIKDAGMSAVDGSINWLDNERVIFVNKDMPGAGKIYIWNTVTGTVELYAPEALGGICYSDGYITYGVKILNNTTYLKTGLMGEENIIVYDWSDEQLRKVRKNRYSCKRFITPEEHNDKRILYLREDHGYLYFGEKGETRNEESPYIFFVDVNNKHHRLPFKKDDYSNPNDYYPFEKGYLVWKIISGAFRWKTQCKKATWIYPNGGTKQLCFDYRDEYEYGSILLYPVATGYLLVSHNIGINDSGDAGIYLYDKNASFQKKILSGHPGELSISDNGCHVAYRLITELKTKPMLQSLNICNTK